MPTFVIILLCLLTGIGTGYILRNRPLNLTPRVIVVIVWLLLGVLGIHVGANQYIISNFPRIGFTSFLLAAAGTAGSVLAPWILWIYIRKKGDAK